MEARRPPARYQGTARRPEPPESQPARPHAEKDGGPELIGEHARTTKVYVRCAICSGVAVPPERVCDLAAYQGVAHVSCAGRPGTASVRR